MLKDKKNDLLHLLTLLESLEKIVLFTADTKDAESFYDLNDQLNFNAVLNLLTHIGETAKKLSDDLLSATYQIEWNKIMGMRNRIAHDYIGLDILKIYNTCKQDVPLFIRKLYPVIRDRVQDGTFDLEELKAASGSRYYKHIRFSDLDA